MKVFKWIDRHFEEMLLIALLFIMMMIMGIQKERILTSISSSQSKNVC